MAEYETMVRTCEINSKYLPDKRQPTTMKVFETKIMFKFC